MPVIIADLVEGFLAAARFVVAPLIPYLTRAWAAVGGVALVTAITSWIQQYLLAMTLKTVATGSVVVAGLLLWATFLAAFNVFLIGGGIRELFNSNPFAGISILAGAMYLVSHAFPLQLAMSLAFAYVQWKFTYLLAAITLNRLARAIVGF